MGLLDWSKIWLLITKSTILRHHQTWSKWQAMEVIIFTKFHYDSSKITNFNQWSNFGQVLLFINKSLFVTNHLYSTQCTLTQRNTREKYHQMALEDKKSPKICQKMPCSSQGLLHRFTKCYFSQNLTVRWFFFLFAPFSQYYHWMFYIKNSRVIFF